MYDNNIPSIYETEFSESGFKKGTQKVIYYYGTTMFTVPLMPPKL